MYSLLDLGRRRPVASDWVAMLFFVLAPLSYYLPRLPGLEVNPVRLLSVALVLLAIHVTLRWPPARGAPRAILAWVSVGVVGTGALSLLASGVMSVFQETFALVTFLSVLLLFSTPQPRLRLIDWIRVVVIICGVIGSVALLTYLRVIPVPSWGEEDRFLAERTASAVDSASGILGQLASLLLISLGRSRRDRMIGYVGFLLSLVNVLLGGFRSYAMVSLLVTGAFLFQVAAVQRIRARSAMLLVLGTLLLVVSDPLGRTSALRERFQGCEAGDPTAIGEFAELDDSLRWREMERDIELSMIRERPWTGHGWGLAHRVTVFWSHVGEIPAFGHNLFTSIPARIGLPAGIGLMALWIALGVRAVRLSRRSRDPEEQLVYWAGSLAVWILPVTGVAQNLLTMSAAFPMFAVFLAPILYSRLPATAAGVVLEPAAGAVDGRGNAVGSSTGGRPPGGRR